MMTLGNLLRRKQGKTWRCDTLKSRIRVSDRQERILGWNQSAMSKMRAVLIGAGGIGRLLCPCLVKKGCGLIDICDHDTVSPETLNRQLFDRRDLFKNKAVRICRKLRREGF